MNRNHLLHCALVVASGSLNSIATAEETPGTLAANLGHVQQIAHIYYNVASGERVVTVLTDSQTSAADSGYDYKTPIWAVESGSPCESAGYTSSFYFAVDDPTNTSMGGATSLATQITVLDMGDIALDTVVDCVQVHWVVAHPDTDSDSDSVGDGVEELAGQWIIWDADNGRPNCHRLPLVDFLFYNLPGNIAGPGSQSAYTLDVDLVAGFSGSDLTFEIGDSDGDCQSAALCHSSVFDNATSSFLPIAQCDNNFDSLPDSDLDGDGLFDFSWTVRFFQPGIGNDFDSDSDTGTAAPSDSDSIGINFAVPEGSAIDNGDGTWTWNVDISAEAPGTGVEDAFVIFNPPIDDGMGGEIINHNGLYWFGGFACVGDQYTPPAMFQFVLYSAAITYCTPADINRDGQLNFFDVSQFIQEYNTGCDYNGDGSTDFFDVSQFILDFSAGGCP